ncbi:MAG: hypothetical protein Q8O84_03560, partial [Nanoarchaeota archaeon]|nr:hypothetical protein [Nanoarchaeota archaeon]
MYIKVKTIKGKKYSYLCKSIRLPDGKIKVMEKRMNKDYNEEKEEKLFVENEKTLNQEYALKNYKIDNIFTEEQIKSIEEIKINYKYLLKKLPKNSLRDLFNRFTANFTYESNALEGNSLTLKDVSIVMFENLTIKDKDLREIYETRNSRKVVELILNKKFNFNHEDLIKMHKLLVKDMDIATGYKKFPNEIIGSGIRPTPPEKVSEELIKLIDFYN